MAPDPGRCMVVTDSRTVDPVAYAEAGRTPDSALVVRESRLRWRRPVSGRAWT